MSAMSLESGTQVRVFQPVPVVVPPGASWAAQAALWLVHSLRRLSRAVWHALEAQGQRRAARDLHQAAQRWQSQDPVLARKLRLAGAYLDPRTAGPLSATSDEGLK